MRSAVDRRSSARSTAEARTRWPRSGPSVSTWCVAPSPSPMSPNAPSAAVAEDPGLALRRVIAVSAAGEVGGEGVGDIAVEGVSGTVVAPRGARVAMSGEVLHVAQRRAGVEGEGDGGVAQ